MLILLLLVSQLSFFGFFIERVYANGEEYDYVDQLSNVDGIADKGTHSNFDNMKAGPDSTYDTLTEVNTGGVGIFSKNPTATTSGTYPWTNPTYAYSSDNSYATAVATLPTYRATGTAASGSGAITVGLPSGMSANDIVILVASTIAGGSISITATGSITTWTAVSGSPVDVTGGEELYVWWGRWSSGTTGPTLTPASDHIVGQTIAYYNCYANGSPIDVSATGTETTSDTSFSFATGLTTTYNNEMIFIVCSTGYDGSSTAQFSSWTGANLGTKTERMDKCVNTGGGGGFGASQAPLVANGAVGTVGATLAQATPKSYIVFALRSTVPNNAFDQIYGTFGITGSGTITKVEIGYEAYSSVAEQLDFYTSSNGGSSWNTIHTTANLGTSDPNAYTYIDVTSDASWTWTLLNDANFKLKVVTRWVSGTPTWSLDALVVRITTPDPNYEIDLEVQWVNANYTRTNEHLCIYTGTLNSENLRVDVWTGSSWTTIITALSANQWNNVSVSDYLTSSTFTIRFKGTVETGDTAQSSWQIDCALLHTWTAVFYERTAEQTLNILPVPSRQSTYKRDAFQPLQILLEVSRHISLSRIASQLLEFVASATRQVLFYRKADVQLDIMLSASRQTSYNRLIQQPLTLLTEASRHLTSSRTASQILTVITQSTRSQTLFRTISQPLQFLLQASRQTSYNRSSFQTLTFLTESKLVKIIGRTASQVLTILTDATRKATFYRIVNQPLEILLSATRKASYHRTAEILIEIRQQLSLTKTPQLPPDQFVPAIPPIHPPTYSLHVHIVDLFGMNAPDLTVKIWRTSSSSTLMATLKTDKNGLSEPVKLSAGQYSIEIYKDEKLQLQQIITLNEDATLEIQIGIPVVITFDIITLAIIATTLILALIYITKRSKR